GLESVRLELFLVSIGHNLYKFHNKQKRLREVA
ncbi:MAG: transposase, partial [Enterocloster citroniae]|nr:transposase [Enterocloster citroniae]